MSNIPLYTQTSYDWHCNKNQPNKPYAVDLNVGTNEYIFGRTTPNNKFIVSTGLINDPKPFGIQMVGGKKNSSKKNSSKKISSKKISSKKGGSSPFKLMNDSGIYNEKNYMSNELIYNALTKSAELKGVNGPFMNSMIDAQNNIMSGGKKKKSTKSNNKPKNEPKKNVKKITNKKIVKPMTKTTKTKKIVKPMTKTTKTKKIVKPMTKTTKSKKIVKPMTKTTKTTKTKKNIKPITKTTKNTKINKTINKNTKPKIKKEKTIKNKIKNLFK
jgi:hypothetical protein